MTAPTPEAYKARIDSEIKRLGLRYVGEGRHRNTYLTPSGKYVIKICKWNYRDGSPNLDEYRRYRNYRATGKDGAGDGAALAHCKVLKNGWLVMEYVRPLSYAELRAARDLNWTAYIDCRQVGLDKRGKLVAYDYTTY